MNARSSPYQLSRFHCMLDLERRRNEVDSPRNDVDHHVDYVFPLRPFISPAKDTEAVANQKNPPIAK